MKSLNFKETVSLLRDSLRRCGGGRPGKSSPVIPQPQSSREVQKGIRGRKERRKETHRQCGEFRLHRQKNFLGWFSDEPEYRLRNIVRFEGPLNEGHRRSIALRFVVGPFILSPTGVQIFSGSY